MEIPARAKDRLENEIVIWMTTVTPGGMPLTSPVWFLWEDDEVLVYSRRSPRVRNIRAHPAVSLNFDGNGMGGDIVVIEGQARIAADLPGASHNPAYLEKYRPRLDQYGWSPEYFTANYPVPLLVEPTRIRAS